MKLRFLFASSLILAQACTNHNLEPDNKPNLRALSANEVQVSSSNADFAFNLFKKIKNNKDGNIFISPLSISTALGMVLNGAEGDTKNGILQTIDYGGLQPADVNEGYRDLSSLLKSMDKKVTLELANSIWYEKDFTINPDFASTVKTDYNGMAQGLDFSSAGSINTINDWVENNTQHKIQNLIEEIPSDAKMFLINATYFKGTWVYQFDKSKTKKDNFYNEDGSTTQVDMMLTKNASPSVYVDNLLAIVDLPYGNGQFSMTILMPNGNNTLSKITDSLSSDYFDNLLFKSGKRSSVEVQMPKFKMTWKDNLNDELSDMGMSVAFSDQANFPYLFTDLNQLTITKVIHQAYVEVNEERTKAAAATGVEVGPTSVGPELIKIDRPFFFVLREKHSKTILFVGQLQNPDTLPAS